MCTFVLLSARPHAALVRSTLGQQRACLVPLPDMDAALHCEEAGHEAGHAPSMMTASSVV